MSKPSVPFVSSLAHHASDPFRLLVESVVDYALYIVDPAGRVASWNPGAERIFGYSAEEIIGQHHQVFFTPEALATDLPAQLRQRTLTEGHCEHELQCVRKNQSHFYAIVTTSNLKDYLGDHAGFSVVTRDITERREADDTVLHERDLSNAILASLPGIYYMYDDQRQFVRWNRRFEEVTGYSGSEIAAMHPLDLFEPADHERVAEKIAEVFRTGAAAVQANLVSRSDHHTPYMFNGVRAEIDGQQYLLGMGIDITEQAAAIEALHIRNNLYAMLSRTNRAVSQCASSTSLFQELCTIAVQTGKFQFAWVGAIEGTSIRNVASAGNDNGYLQHLVISGDDVEPSSHGPTGQAALTGQPMVVNDFMTSPMTSAWHAMALRADFAASAAFPLKERGRVVAVMNLYASVPGFFTEELVSTLSEITPNVSFALDALRQERERTLAEQRLARSDALLRVASRVARMGGWAVELEGHKVIWSDDLLDLLDLSRDQPLDFEFGIHIYLPQYQQLVRDRFEQCLQHGTPFDEEVQCVKASGGMLWVRIMGEPNRDTHGTIIGARGTFQDITDRMQAAETIQLRNRAIQSVSQGIIITDPNQPDNPIIFASAGFERMTGYLTREVIGRNCRFLQGPDTDTDAVAQLRSATTAGLTCSVEILNYRKDGTPFWNQLTITPIFSDEARLMHFVGVQSDVTEQRRLKEQFHQAQKMEAVGQLAGGIAHDFNNLLTVINGYSELLLAGLTPDHPMREELSEIQRAGERASGLTRQLLAFSRQQVIAPRVFNLNSTVRDTERMLRRVIGEDIMLATQLSPTLGPVKADPGQIEQVLMNLAVNARDAMPGGGKLTIETQMVYLDATYCQSFGDLEPGEYVMLAITDSGTGMNEATRAHMFEPFFTTKEHGSGTGLGLATVHGIIKQSRGHVSVYSELGIGTTIKVYLPVVHDPLSADHSPDALVSMPPGTETLLLVEDEEAVRALASRVLTGCGYRVIVASNGRDALQRASVEREPIHLLLSDVVMPEVGGRALAEHLALVRPECKVLFLSGYTSDAGIRHGVLEAEFAFLQKPFTPSALAQKVRAVLDAAPDVPGAASQP